LGIRLQMHASLHLEQAFKEERGLLPLVAYGMRLTGRFLQKILRTQPVDVSAATLQQPPGDYFEDVCHRYEPSRLKLFVHLLVPSERKPWQIAFWHHYARNG